MRSVLYIPVIACGPNRLFGELRLARQLGVLVISYLAVVELNLRLYSIILCGCGLEYDVTSLRRRALCVSATAGTLWIITI